MAKRLLVTAIERGLAGDITGELAESDRQERATQQAAQEVANMIAAGQGDRVIALFAAVAPNTDEDASNAAKTGLLGALARLPGELASRDQAEQGESPGESVEEPPVGANLVNLVIVFALNVGIEGAAFWRNASGIRRHPPRLRRARATPRLPN